MQDVTKEKHQWYLVEFYLGEIPQSLLHVCDTSASHPDMHLPPRNTWQSLACRTEVEAISLLMRQREEKAKATHAPYVSRECVIQDRNFALYHEMSLAFNSPRVFAFFRLRFNDPSDRCVITAQGLLFKRCLTDAIQETLFQAASAGNAAHLSVLYEDDDDDAAEIHTPCLNIQLSAYADTIMEWTRTIFEVLTASHSCLYAL